MIFPSKLSLSIRVLAGILLIMLSGKESFTQQITRYDLSGKWKVAKVFEMDKDITPSLDQQANRWIAFIDNERYESDGFPFGKIEGVYLLDESSAMLVLKSNTGRDSIAWKVRYNGEYLIFQGTDRLAQYRFELVKDY